MIEAIEQTIASRKLLDAETPVLAMVSGGSDSTALAYIVADLFARGKIGQPAILHVNHKIRGEEADADARFVERLAQRLGIPFFACEIDVPALVAATGGNAEAIGRRERYLAAHEALESLCRHTATPVSIGRIVTAHTQDDRVENFYMRSIKGTGPGGFRSMLYQNGPVVRPCLDVSREALRSYIADLPESLAVEDEAGNRWREDATNAHTDRFRAFVRHEIVPKAKERNPQLLDTLCRTMNLIADEDDYLQQLASQASEQHAQFTGDDGDGGHDSCLLLPSFGEVALPVQRRAVVTLLQQLIGGEVRIEAASVDAVLSAFGEDNAPISGFVTNIQGNLAVSANKHGVLVEPMAVFRARRKPAHS